MDLPVMPPVSPMLAKAVKGMPTPDSLPTGLLYEPKWDGFRCIVFRDGDEVELGSRNERPLTRYFPDVVEAVKGQLPERCVVDGEIVIVTPTGLDFDALQLRLHPAESRVRKLAAETPASFVAFDLLAIGDESLMEEPLSVRRSRLEQALKSAAAPVYLTPATYDVAEAEEWFTVFEGAGLDGVIAKPLDITYRPDVRAMFKIKHARTADCVVAGFRWHKSGPIVGSLILGLYDADGNLHHVGVAASFTMKRRAELVDELAPYRENAMAGHPWEAWGQAHEESERMPGAASRWNAGKDLSWEPLRPELVVEVAYDQMQGDRFRHATQFVRWRTDRDPSSCRYEQLEKPVKFALADIFS
ncbi:ATP-dependent DNA ligase [Acidothermaceae bacterium B102]|nr:ATP-dependent DNA ligase [Acidothermaceae bacterium B102]